MERRPNRSVARSNSCASIAARCAIRASETRYRRIMLMRSKSTPSSSPRAERSHSQRQEARSEPGAAMRAITLAMASARCVPLKPSRSSKASRPSRSMAHSPTCSTPTERGRISSREPTSTVCRSGRPVPPDGALLSNCAAMRWACRSTSSGQDSGTSSAWRSSSCWIRLHSTAQCRRSTGKSLPRLSRVRWRTFSPLRSERTRRCE